MSGRAGEGDALADQARTDSVPTRPRLDEEYAELGHIGVAPAVEDATGPGSVELGDPGTLAFGLEVIPVIGDDPGDQSLEVCVPAVLVGVDSVH